MIDALNRGDPEDGASHIDPDVEIRAREGTVHGVSYFERFLRTQLEQFAEFRMEAEDFHEAEDGTIIACLAVTRRHRDGEDAIRMWPANVYRFDDDDKVVFFEGFPRQTDALR